MSFQSGFLPASLQGFLLLFSGISPGFLFCFFVVLEQLSSLSLIIDTLEKLSDVEDPHKGFFFKLHWTSNF